MTTRPSTVLVIAPKPTLAASIEARLRGHCEWRVAVGVASQLSTLVEQHQPNVIVLAEAPSRVARAFETLRDLPHAPPIMLLLTEPGGAWTPQIRRAGVRAVMPVDAPAAELTAALRAVSQGLIVLHPDAVRAAAPVSSLEAHAPGALTSRELEIVDMMTEGLSNQMIARRLGISRHTVKFHVASILGKLQASSRTEAVVTAVRRGLVSV
jgi:NarL family two-component system response regulator YdfI